MSKKIKAERFARSSDIEIWITPKKTFIPLFNTHSVRSYPHSNINDDCNDRILLTKKDLQWSDKRGVLYFDNRRAYRWRTCYVVICFQQTIFDNCLDFTSYLQLAVTRLPTCLWIVLASNRCCCSSVVICLEQSIFTNVGPPRLRRGIVVICVHQTIFASYSLATRALGQL